ncbi:MAG: Cupin 2 conserved barrel domain protein [Candidatus Kaiserbacteria bacterium GW2011_GWC2_49_12]|uniref:Cupin 2 conserved barrel domain protein n=4 Tax=Candidatus Kaiseribacteriota TaxID=1752734 RepID=A0A0G1WH22_9BACT|nr:MAG: Cupin 2 conserved barrel domain protein [Candidatus Kaiserbacteria bacterium GW2011_GWC2_49_12]KKW18066.1 MAG: Cupin 2 conserved barrel domain protein [Candidatus Kaiserbacteria bacterium GW2011_GWB1_50_17]KKW18559.1 MAG: Cupin 2 conserved barrel domain protein [Candidatus Kaiserbacteria bacterium GW2011_GWA1_50_28]OGG87218.1 MAG: hypothetical protein A3H15_01335 [Candidatus Kaiserbacteria bacterium RIFCSPLOWO2_12_FULL_50_28]HCM43468.1 hypothetical protein [Candidatus Kaiserbacteria bac
MGSPAEGVKNTKLAPVFSDARGDIFDIAEGTIGHVGMVTFAKGAIRGKHYHKESTQYSYVISGTLKFTVSDIDGENAREYVLEKGDLSTIPPRVIHMYEALSDAVMLDLTTLARTNDGYEKDTVRIS